MSGSEPMRLPCRTIGCPNTVQPATAVRTGGYCGPCKGKRDAEARRAYVSANRRDLDRYAGVTDPVELLRLMHTPPKPAPLVNLLPPSVALEDVYLALTPADARRLMAVAVELLDGDKAAATSIGRCLAAFTGYTLDAMLDEWLDRGDPHPAILFRGAGPHVRDRLMGMVDDGLSTLQLDHALSALAWVGDKAAVRFIAAADADRPAWSRKLHVGPAAYAHVAGWEPDHGQRRDLTLDACYGMHVATAGEGHADHVGVMQVRDDPCPWCGQPLVDLLRADLDTPPLEALRHLGPRVEVVTCPHCTCYGFIYGELDAAGHGRWAAANLRPASLPAAPGKPGSNPWAAAAVRLVARRSTHGADEFLPTTLSQIGGLPAWVQDAQYPTCLGCRRTMMFLSQIDQGAFPGHEGIYYAFVCPSCRTTATTYQQT